jgi:large repetitive protein
MKIRPRHLLILLGLLAAFAPAARAAVAFTVTPAAVSNTYSGKITLQITGLTNTETVVVQKFLDANTNGVIDAGDSLWQQFNLTDGQASVFHDGGTAVTNFNVPGDTDTTGGQITAPIILQNGDFAQTTVGKYLYKLSSPAGHFTALTNSFSVTNFPYAQSFTGTVFSNNTATAVGNAVIILFQPASGGNLNPQGGAVANNAGNYTIKVPPGTYLLAAFRSNYLANLATAPTITLGSGSTITTNLTLTNTTQSISGRIVDAATPTLGLPGLLVPLTSSDNFLALGYSDTNGNFTVGTRPGVWKIESGDSSLIVHGYLSLQNNIKTNTASGSVGGVTNALPKASAIFYGSVKDNFGKALAGIDLYASDNNGQYQSDGYTDTNGNYVAGASAADWHVSVSSDSGPTNYIFSNGSGATLTNGQARLQSFTAILATNHISGHVQFNGNPVSGVQVYAAATINAVDYNSQVDTDSSGNYTLNVANGDWSISLNRNGGSDSLDNILGGGNYQSPNSQNATINNNNATNNFTVQPCSGVQIFTTSLTNGQVGAYYDQFLLGSTCSGNVNWTLNDPQDFPSSLGLAGNGEVQGMPDTAGTYNFSVTLDDGNGHSTNQSVSLYIADVSSPLQVATTDLPTGTNGMFYSQTIQVSGGTLPYSWSIPDYSADPPANLTLATNGVLSGTLTITGGPYYFDVAVTDGAANTAYQTLSLYIVNPPLPPLVITNLSLPNGNVGAPYSAQLGATGGQSPDNWQLATGSANPPAGLTLYPSGLISGTPTTNKVSTFKVQATDANFTTTNKVLSITINARPTLGSQTWLTNRFQMRLTGASNQNYTVQMATNLGSAGWISLFFTNNATTNSFMVADPNATNQQRYYRVLIGP